MLNDNQEFCANCGVKVGGGGRFCQNCGGELMPGANVCEKCGAPVNNPETPPVTPPLQTVSRTAPYPANISTVKTRPQWQLSASCWAVWVFTTS